MRLVGGKICYIVMQGKPIALEDNRTEPTIQRFRLAALKAKNLKEGRLELAFIP